MSPLTIVLIVIIVVLTAVLIALFFLGKRAQKKQEAQQEQIQRTAQPVSMLIIDKKKLSLKKSGLPDMVINQTPFYARLTKVPIVKAKVGQKVLTLICDPEVFKIVPVKKEVKAMVSGIYISSIKSLHGKVEVPVKKQGLISRIVFGKKEN